jgi:hypothetical protein
MPVELLYLSEFSTTGKPVRGPTPYARPERLSRSAARILRTRPFDFVHKRLEVSATVLGLLTPGANPVYGDSRCGRRKIHILQSALTARVPGTGGVDTMVTARRGSARWSGANLAVEVPVMPNQAGTSTAHAG